MPLWAGGAPHPNEVDSWMLVLETSVRVTLQELTEEAISTFSTVDIDKWIKEWPAQVTLACSNVAWTLDVCWALSRGDRMTMPRLPDSLETSAEYKKVGANLTLLRTPHPSLKTPTAEAGPGIESH